MPGENKSRPPYALRIFQLRKELGLNQAAFAARIGIEQGTVSKWEGGKAKPPRRTYTLLVNLATEPLKRQLAEDGGVTYDPGAAASPEFRRHLAAGPAGHVLDKELLEAVIEVAFMKYKHLSPKEFTDKLIFYYELCQKMKTEDPAMMEKFLKSA